MVMELPGTRKLRISRGGKSGIKKMFDEELVNAVAEELIEAVIEGGTYRKRPKHKTRKSTTGKNGKGYKVKGRRSRAK
jgi:phage gpG-like protein